MERNVALFLSLSSSAQYFQKLFVEYAEVEKWTMALLSCIGCGAYNNTRIYDHNGAFAKEVFSHVSLRRMAIYFPSCNTNADSPLHPHIERCIDPSHEWSMRRSESTGSSIVTIVDIVVVTQWFRFLTRDSPAVRLGANVVPTSTRSTKPAPCSLPLSPLRFFSFPIVSKDRYWRECHMYKRMGGSYKHSIHFL